MNVKLEPTFMQVDLKTKQQQRVTPLQSQSSAFKAVNHSEICDKSSSSSSSSCSSSSSSSFGVKTNKVNSNKIKIEGIEYNLSKGNENSSHSSSSLSPPPLQHQSSSSSIAASIAAATQMNPFYIDKIFNFQNMFLFSNAAAAAGNGNNISSQDLNHIGQFNNRCISPLLSTTTSKTSVAPPDIHNYMQQSFMQNFFQYCSTNTIKNHNNDKLLDNGSKNVSKSTNFSIDNILSSNNDNQNKKNNESSYSNMNESVFNLAHQSLLSQQSNQFNQNNNHPNYDQTLKHFAKHVSNNSKHFRNQISSKTKQQTTPIALTALIPPSLASMISSSSSSTTSCSSQLLAANNTQNNNISMARLNSIKQFGPHKAALMTNSYKNSNQESNNGMQIVSKSKNAKKYKCDLCGRGFSRSNTLITHRVS